MKTPNELLESNQVWAREKVGADVDFFVRHAAGQSPKYLWIGCADSRVLPNEMTKSGPGELFVHRNVANVVGERDLNLLSVVQYAVEVLKVEHIIVCGHYGCGGVKAALENQKNGLIDGWLESIKEVVRGEEAELKGLESAAQFDRLCELNAIAQARNLNQTSVLQEAWTRGQKLDIRSWIYDLKDGCLKELAEPIVG